MIKIFNIVFLFTVTSFSMSLPVIEGQFLFNKENVEIVLSRKEVLLRVINKESENLLTELKNNVSI